MTADHALAFAIVAFWVGALFGAVAADDDHVMIVPAILTALVVLFFAARGC